ELEITESAVLNDLPRARETLHNLQNMGVTLAVDDFGTGYASLNHMAALPLDVLKVDRLYVQKMFTDPTAAAVVRFAVDLARHLNATVVA
ncbi:MAG TPA: EAL domain-containing protein, partial [Ilumatobacteraceae bacterium]|nr:EAL domain-containing protein [Ilumatobacteraceae bacterium]